MKHIINLSVFAALLMVAGSVIAAETKTQTQTGSQAVKEQVTTTQVVQTDEEKAREICKKNRIEASRFDSCVKGELEKIKVAKKGTSTKGTE